MFNWLKDWLNPTPYNSTTNFKCDVPMPKVKPPREDGVSVGNSGMKILPKIGDVVIYTPQDIDVKIKAFTKVAGKSAAVWQYYDEFGFGYPEDFEVIKDD